MAGNRKKRLPFYFFNYELAKAMTPETPEARAKRHKEVRQSKRACECPDCGSGVLPVIADPRRYAKILAKALEAEAA